MNLSRSIRRGSQWRRLRTNGEEPPVELTLVCADVVEFTRMTERLGDRRALEAMRSLARIVRHETRNHRGTELELQGDAFLLGFAAPHAGVCCAVAIQRALSREPIVDEDVRLEVRISIHTGFVLRDGDGYFGANMILPYRLLERASAGEVILSSATSSRVQDRWALTSGSAFLAKGFSRELSFRGVQWSPDGRPHPGTHPAPDALHDRSPRPHAA